MTEVEAAKNFIARLRGDLPEFSERTDEEMIRRGFARGELMEVPHVWLETAADVTNQDIASRDQAEVASQVGYVAAALERGDARLCRALDCTYVESLLWNVDDSNLREWAWGQFPMAIKQHHELVWGPWRPRNPFRPNPPRGLA